MHSLSLSALAKKLGRAKSGLHKLAKRGQIPKNPDGTFDVAAVEAALAANLDPARAAVRPKARSSVNSEQPGEQRTVRTPSDAENAVSLIAAVLQREGVSTDGGVDYNATRMAESILKSYEREQRMAERRKELVPLAKVAEHISRAFVGYRQSMQRLPSRYAAQMAAELGCDAAALDAAMSKAIAAELEVMSAPVVRV